MELITVINSLEFNILEQIENDLDLQEKISMIFLMGDYTKPVINIIHLMNPINQKTILSEFVIKNKYKWREKCLEALYLINNRKILKKLGLDDEHIENLLSQIQLISPVIKSLYKLCENITDDELKNVMTRMRNDIECNSQLLTDNVLYFEIYILNWIHHKHIIVKEDGTWDINDIILRHLKTLNKDNIYMNLIKPSTGDNKINDCIMMIKKALCIIINQINFNGKYEKRTGTNADAQRLKQTFENFGFKVYTFIDLTKDHLLNTMRNVSNNYGTSWDCLFFCILSHGKEGTIITSDEKEISLEAIDDCICTSQMTNVMKIVIIQACQGERRGISLDKLRLDGPGLGKRIFEISSKDNFCIFMSTMSGFISVRHQENGSWFIQTVCQVLEDKQNITFSEFIREVTKRTKNYSATVDTTPFVNQLPELIKSRYTKDFKFPPKKLCN